ncbi:MAG TPA: DUF2723 domain-containing protein [Kofleriaceae bacterium]|nr:DUF2723 domain-containing protein [Kofleriaceae bacterium]
MRKTLLDRGGLLALAAFACYAWLAPAYVVDGDNAEFSALGQLGGCAHPSGYPVYVLWLRAWSWLPVSPARGAAIATALLAAASILALHAACRAWGARPLAATIACALFAGAPLPLALSSEAEVFAGNDLAVACVLWLAARGGPVRGWRRAAALGVVAGLGLANHLTCVVVAPIGLVGIVRAARESRWTTALPIALGGLALGLAPYAYLFVADDTAASWGKVHDLGGLVDMFLRRDYGGSGAFLANGDAQPVAGANLGALATTLARTWLWLPGALGVAMLAWRTARPREGETRIAFAALAASWLIAGPLLVTRFDLEPTDLGLYVVERFHLLPALVLAIPVALALDELAAHLPRLRALARPAAPIAATLGFAAIAGSSLARVQRVHSPAFEHYVRDTIATLPPGAVVLGGGDELVFGGMYMQAVLGERPDVTLVSWHMFARPWYRERAARRGVSADEVKAPYPVRIALHVLASGRPLLVGRLETEVLQAFPSYPYGTLMRVLPRSSAPPSLDEVVAINRDLYGKLELDYPRPGPDDEWPATIHVRYAYTWRLLARVLAKAGRRDDAARALELAREIEPVP